MSEDPLIALQNRFAWLERHVAEQDRAMLKLEDEMRRLKRKLEVLQQQQRAGAHPAEPSEGEERPPHY